MQILSCREWQMRKGQAGGSCSRQNISLPHFYNYTFCFRNAGTFCCDLKCFAFSFQNSIFYLRNQPIFKWEKKKNQKPTNQQQQQPKNRKDPAQPGCTAPERSSLHGAERSLWGQLTMNCSSFFLPPPFSFNQPARQITSFG